MKYCIKCGMLLEDTQTTCIGCGSDVSTEENYSLYPLEMAESIEQEKKQGKKRSGLIVVIIGVVVLLIALIGVLIWYVSTYQIDSLAESVDSMASGEELYSDEDFSEYEDSEEDDFEDEYEDASEDLEEDEYYDEGAEGGLSADLDIPDSTESEAQSELVNAGGPKTVKIDKGSFYSQGSVQDAAGNTIFTTLYPEDFVNVSSGVDYDKYSLKYPESFTFVVSNEQNIVQFTYISAQHFWYRNSSKGKSRSNERDVFNYMTYYTYDGVKPYLEALINTSYKDIKKLEFVEKKTIDEGLDEKLKKFSDDITMELTGNIGDYASIGSDTEYAAMAAEHEACIYSYKATSRQDNIIYMDFYIPVVANTLSYSSAKENDKGEVVEWVVPCIIAFEAGNEELHNAYNDAFKTFIYNSKVTKEFFYDNYAYSQYVEGIIRDGDKPDALNSAKLKEYHEAYSDSTDIGKYNSGLYDFLTSAPSTCSVFEKEDGGAKYYTSGSNKIGYYDPSSNKFFTSIDDSEYPGESYQEMKATVGTPDESDSSAENEEETSGGVQ